MCDIQGVINFNLGEEPTLPPFTEAQIENHVMGVVFAQPYTLENRLEKFGDQAAEATTKELKKIHDMGTFEPLDSTKLTKKERIEAVSSLLFITEKKDGRIKAEDVLLVANNENLRGMIKQQEAPPPYLPMD